MNAQSESTRAIDTDRRARRIERWLFALCALTLFYFYPGGDPNQVSRLLLVEAIVLHGRPDITHDHGRTVDKGEHDGKYYSDKAPGISLLAVPAYAAMRGVEKITKLNPESRIVARARVHALTFVLAGLPALFTAVLLARVMRRLGTERVRAALLACGALFGTLLFPYGTMLYGHAMAALLLMAAFVIVAEREIARDAGASDAVTVAAPARARGPAPDASARTREDILLGALAAGGFVVEYPTALPFVVLIAFALARTPRGQWLRAASLIAAGAAAPLAIHAAFAVWAFGSPLALPYKFVVEPLFRAHTTEGLFGVGAPVPGALYGALFSPYRGLFFFCPITALAAAGYGAWLARGRHLSVAVLAAAVSLAGLAFTWSYYAWHGGLATGARHLVPFCSFFVLPIAVLVERSPVARRVTFGVAAASSLVMLATVAVTTHLPEEDPFRGNPLQSLVVPNLIRGDLGLNFMDTSSLTPRADVSFDLGSLFGAPPWLALAIPIAAWALSLTFVIVRAPRTPPPTVRA